MDRIFFFGKKPLHIMSDCKQKIVGNRGSFDAPILLKSAKNSPINSEIPSFEPVLLRK